MSNPVYFCHQCKRQVRSQESDLKCSDCGGEFIEELENSPFQQLLFTRNAAAPRSREAGDSPQVGGNVHASRLQNPSNPFGAFSSFLNALYPQRASTQAQASNAQPNRTRPEEASGNEQQIEPEDDMRQFWEQLMGGLGSEPIRISFNLAGDGAGGHTSHAFIGNVPANFPDLEQLQLDQIVTNLLNSFESHQPALGLPPDVVARIPRVDVTQKHVDNETQCTTCMETFRKGEKVLELNCRHIFHQDCVVPWFDRHRTCPICRQEVDPSTQTVQSQPTSNLPPNLNDLDLD